jgi:hypothetical protein
METEIVFCERCGVSIPETDLARLRQASGGRDLCATCVAPPADGDLKLYFCENCRVSIAVTDVLTGAAAPEGPGYLCAGCGRSTPAERMARRTAVEREMAAVGLPGRGPAADPIYFCDACNSSIPASLVATGRALVRGGRTYCERCRPRLEAERPHARPGVGFLPVLAAALLAAAATAAGLAWKDGAREEGLARDRNALVDEGIAEVRREARAARSAAETARETADRLDRAALALERKVDGVKVEALAARAAADKAGSQPNGADRVARLERHLADLEEALKILREDMAVLAGERLKAPPAVVEGPPEAPETPPPSPQPMPAPGEVVPSPQVQRYIVQLDDKDAGVRFAAAIEIGKLGERTAWQALAKRLKADDDPFVRRACARSIGDLRAYEAFPDLLEAFLDGEEYVAIQSNRVLMSWMKEDLHAQLERDPTEKELAARDFGFKQNQAKSDRKKVADKARKWWDDNRERMLAAAR